MASSFLYYLPHSVAPRYNTKADIPAVCKLAEVLEDAEITPFPIINGPDGGSGTMLHLDMKKEDVPGMFPETQEWIEVKDGEKTTHWLGWKKASKPNEESLRRKERFNGYPVTMGDEQWIVPAIHSPRTTLPKVFKMSGNGPGLSVMPEYEAIQKDSERVFEWVLKNKLNEPATDLNGLFVFDYVIRVLQLNYRIGAWELSTLGVLTNRNLFEVLDASVAWPAVEAEIIERLKKNTPTDTSNIESGC